MSAAAAILFGLDPSLTSSQVTTILERHADDVNPANGCAGCLAGRDQLSGWGRLDVKGAAAALSSAAPLPPADRLEPNDSLSQARAVWGRKAALAATLDYWDDPVDTYRVKLARGQRLEALFRGRRATVGLTIWRAGTSAVTSSRPTKVAATARPGKKEHLAYRARKSGWYDVKLHVTRPGGGRYRLQLTKSR